jgi:hypothetical protein
MTCVPLYWIRMLSSKQPCHEVGKIGHQEKEYGWKPDEYDEQDKADQSPLPINARGSTVIETRRLNLRPRVARGYIDQV